MAKNIVFVPDFDPFWPKFGPLKFPPWGLPPLDVIDCCKLSFYVISRKTKERNLR